ncbi:hypothetical protein [Methylobacterium aquaticum]|uniref:Uncharacterized protein n=1 Tax=Methylobacterium aquaticum TaxID=270351 RepID=A0A0J6VJM4_9HYPH|nr:hypothetical protein [Methylobacterium aquaticum]KMO39331.1 hypothetical protein VP06_04110 [Methylobacterium aquaticum]
MGRPRDPDEDARRDLDELGRAYTETLTQRRAHVQDGLFIQLTTNLGIILTLLGWRPDRARPVMPSSPATGL